jgi:hypothetical protein
MILFLSLSGFVPVSEEAIGRHEEKLYPKPRGAAKDGGIQLAVLM